MRHYLLAAAAVIMPSSTQAATFVFAGGNYQSGVTSPNPLLLPDILSIETADSKVFGAGTFTNQSGRVNWSGGTIFFGGGAANVVNNGTWNATGNDQITFFSGGGTFTNTGLFQKTGGTGTTFIGINNFINSGTIDAQTGIIRIDSGGSNIAFNAGTAFTGAGIVSLTNNATFNGGFSSANLDFAGGTYAGNAASLSGSADFLAGSFTGGWNVATGSTLNITGASSKSFGTGTFDNDGTLAWSGGTIFLAGANASLVNDGIMTATGNDSMTIASGSNTFTNNGLFQKTGGTGTTTFNAVNVVNAGTIQADTGTIQFAGGGSITFNAGTAFAGAGVVSLANNATFNGGFSSTNLDFAGGTYTGNAASLSGTADFLAGSFRGGWNLTTGSTLNLIGAGGKSFGTGTFDNDGTLAWSGGTIALAGAGSNLVNDGLMTATSNDIITPQGGIGGFTNNGTFVKSGSTGTTGLIDSRLDNNGTMDVQSGTIALPRNFVNDGTLAGTGTYALDGTLTNNGIIAPGNGGGTVGTLNLTGNYLQAATGSFAAQLGGTGIADLFAITGTAQLGGTLALSCFGGCAFGNGDVFTLLDSVGQLTGTFGNVTANGFLNGFTYDVLYDYTASRVQLRVNSAGSAPPVNPGAVPEPATWAMLLLGFGSMGYVMRRPKGNARIRFA